MHIWESFLWSHSFMGTPSFLAFARIAVSWPVTGPFATYRQSTARPERRASATGLRPAIIPAP